MLKKRFGCKQQIVDKHLEALFNVDPVTGGHNVRALQRLFDAVTSHIRSLQALEVQPTTYASIFCPRLLNKIPNDMKLIVTRTLTDDGWNLNALLTAIEQELIARERSGLNDVSRHPQQRDDRSPVATAATLLSSGSQPACCYCNDHSHKSINCTSVTKAEARQQILKKTGRCFVCLRKGHLSRQCRSTSNCRLCKGRHHTSICSKPTNNPNQVTNVSTAVTSTQSNLTISTTPALNPQAPAFVSPPTSTSLYLACSRAVLLQTATAEVYNPTDSSSTQKLRIILDNGSQRSYLTDRVKNSLKLTATRRQKLSIATFGATKGVPRYCDVVRIGIVTQSGQREELELLTIPHICEPLLAQPVDLSSAVYGHLAPLRLADTYQGDIPIEVDMLIGSDLYWQLVTGEIIRGQAGPVAVNTKLGWVLSGPVHSNIIDGNNATVLTVQILHISTIPDEQLDKTLQAFWELESLGIDPGSSTLQDHPRLAIQLKDGRYEVSLPWREFHQPLPDNYALSLRRLKGLLQ